MIQKKVVGTYQIGHTLGQGMYSKVKYGLDTETKKSYAIKVMKLTDIKQKHMEVQIKREIAIMKLIKHKHVVELREVLQTERNIYIVMELITGGELFDKIVAATKFSENVARRYFQQLVLAVEYCHQQGIAHRDLKPENLLVDSNDHLKVADFGLSIIAKDPLSTTGPVMNTVCGTPKYVAPEVIKEKGYNGFIADIWSMGVILYVMIAGVAPFRDNNLPQLFKKIESGKVNYPAHFSKGVKDLIANMLQVNPKKRITISQIKKHSWFKVDFHEQVSSVITVSHTQINNAVKDSFYKVTMSEEPKRIEAPKLNAFEIASNIIMGSISVMATGENPYAIRRNTRFMAKGNLTEVRTRLVQALEAEDANPTEKSTHELKCFAYCGIEEFKSLVTFSIDLTETIASQLTIVEFRRGRGGILDFQRFYRLFLQGPISDIVLTNGLQQ